MISAQFKKVLLQLLLVLTIYQAIRLLFYVVNHDYFQVHGVGEYLVLAFHSLRFDLSTALTLNSLYIILALLPFSFVCQKWFQRILQTLFIFSNSIAFIFDLADVGYFPFQRKRMTSEVFDLIGNKSDFLDLLPSYLISFWYVPIAILLFVFAFIYINYKINKTSYNIDNQLFNIKNGIIVLVFWGFSFILIRGGLQLKPIMKTNALAVTTNDKVALVFNTPFSIIHTLEEQRLPEYQFFNESELHKYFNPIQNFKRNGQVRDCNIVVIILESFGKSYTGLGGRKSYTPFLDSLFSEGLVFNNAFANANISASGIPAIISGIPAFMEEPFTTSPYGNNQIDALPNLLSKIGYSTSFFHGGTNGTMSFDLFTKNAGYEKYFGRTEYGNDKDYDGTWGIWDEPFLHYFMNQLDKEKQPFFSTVFTLSSHEPFRIPKEYQNASFAKLGGIERGIAYSDMALRKFFKAASQKTWFKNTLFVITPDHNFVACHDDLGYYNNGFGLYSIPVLMYKPNDQMLKGVDSTAFQQIDILPTVLDYVHYPNSFFAFGKSAFDTTRKAFVYNSASNYNQFLLNDYLVTANDTSVNGLYYFKQDSFLHNNLLANDSLKRIIIPYFKAFKQLLNQSIIENKMSVSK